MGLIGWLRGPGARAEGGDPAMRPRDPTDDAWFEEIGRPSKAKVVVTVDAARRVPVVRDCLAVRSQSVAALAFGLFRKRSDGSREPVAAHPVLAMLRSPNPVQSSYEFLAQLVDDLDAEGTFLAVRVPSAEPGREDLWRVARRHYQVEQLPDRHLRFRITEPGRAEQVLLQEEVWYLAVPPVREGFRGRSPILDDGVEVIGAALALQDYANTFFANDATPRVVYKHKGNFVDEASKRNWLDAIMRWSGGRNRHRPAVLEYGIEPVQLAHTNEDAQFLDTRREVNLDIARLWRVPPHKVGILERATHQNIEHQSLEFVTDCLMPVLELIERSVAKWFLDDDPALYFEFNVASLLRGDLKSRYDAYALGRQWGWLSVNDIRRRENENGIGPQGDRYIEPLNMGAPGESPRGPASTERAIAFLRDSVARNGGRPALRLVEDRDAA